jgi:hypothetical protein
LAQFTVAAKEYYNLGVTFDMNFDVAKDDK